MNTDRHLMEDLLDTPLPAGWTLHNAPGHGYYARHPDLGQTDDHEDPQDAAAEARAMHDDDDDEEAPRTDVAPQRLNDDAPTDDLPDGWTLQTEGDAFVAVNEDTGETTDPLPRAIAVKEAHQIDAGEDPVGPALQEVRNDPVERAEPDEARPDVYDADTGDWIEVSEAMQARAEEAMQGLSDSMFATAYWLTVILDEKLYLLAGDVDSRTDFIDNVLPFSSTTAENYVRVARSWFPALRGDDDEQPQTFGVPTDAADGDSAGEAALFDPEGSPPQDVPEHVRSLGLTKLQQFARLPQGDVRHYVEHGEIPARDGQDGFTAEEVADMTARRATKIVSERLNPLKEKLESEKEARLKAEAEREALAQHNARLKEQNEHARALEEHYRGGYETLERKREALGEVEDLIDEVNRRVHALGIDPDDPRGLQQDLVHVLAKYTDFATRGQDAYHDVRKNLIATAR